MALHLDSTGFHDALIVLGAAGLVIPAFAALRISPVLGFILVGVVVGPFGLGAARGQYVWLEPLAIDNPQALAPLAEIGIAMLLFSLGMELSVERLRTMRRQLLALGPAQLLLACAALALLLTALGFPVTGAIVAGMALALSSTAVALQLLAAKGRLTSRAGRDAIAVLLFQDIAIAPILLLLGAFAVGGSFGTALWHGLLAIAVVVGLGALALRPLFLQAARTRSPELFLAAALVVVIGAAGITSVGGLSPVIGALIAGILLAETEYRRQIEASVAPFQGLLLGVFLIFTGMRLDLGAIAAAPLAIIGLTFAVCALKALTLAIWLRLQRRSAGVSAHVALLLAAPSETSLVVLAAASAAGLIAAPLADRLLLVIALGLALAPLLGLAGHWLEARLLHPDMAVPAAEPGSGRTIIIGFGRVGQMVAAMLDAHQRPWLAIDSDPDAVARHRASGQRVIYGDARRPELLDRLDLDAAAALVFTIDATASLEMLVRSIRRDHPRLCLVARARDADHARRLYRAGATDAVPETVEASLQLAEAVLVDLGVPMGPVIVSIHEKRAELRSAMERPEPREPLGRLRDAGPQ